MNGDQKVKFFTKGFKSFLCANQLTMVSTLRCRKVSRNVKFDSEKSSLAFSRYSERKPKFS